MELSLNDGNIRSVSQQFDEPFETVVHSAAVVYDDICENSPTRADKDDERERL